MTGLAAEIAREFLVVVWDGNAPDEAILLRALDKLLSRSHDVPFANCAECDDQPPQMGGSALYRKAAERFPDLGMYPVSDPLKPIEDDRMLADAIDDLADMTRDLSEVLWRDENLGSDDAAWCFRLLYFHWARHARELSLYLHARQFG